MLNMCSNHENVEKFSPNGDSGAEWRVELNFLFHVSSHFILGYSWDFPCIMHTQGKFPPTDYRFWT